MSLYECDGCSEPIRPDKARIQCHTCTDYNLCANCFVIKNVTRTHTTNHPTSTYKTSGTTTPAVPLPIPPRARKDTLTSTPPKKVDLPTANWGALWDIVKPKQKTTKATPPKGGGGELISISPPNNEDAHSYSNHHQRNQSYADTNHHHRNLSYADTKLCPDLPTCPGKIELDAFTNPYASMAPPVPAEWYPFFQPDGTQNAIFVDLMTTLFLHLDVENMDSLSPEVYSAFLEMQGVPMEDNIWQKTLLTEGANQNQEIADLELGIFYKNHEIQHTLAVRHSVNLPPLSPSPTAGERIRRSISLGANMPMLSRQGFIDVMAMELLRDPDEGHRRLGGVVRDYEVWRGLGEVPRRCFLEGKVEGRKGRGKRKSLLEMSEEKEEVERRIMEAMLKAAGEVGEVNVDGMEQLRSTDEIFDISNEMDMEMEMEMEMETETVTVTQDNNTPAAPDNPTFDSTDDNNDDDEKFIDEKEFLSLPLPLPPPNQTHEVDLPDVHADHAMIKKVPVVVEPCEETNWV
ncbi:hypothetical protein DSL72_002462 [Monilinia vaccinii-corymbosi]|uniref:ZZ-type domain-containing protein n=1 Tax=Monilinia vaccinii-corymbosi TaxID=61207 RepID=A0A8A3PCS5_9HELO|nr:hypothetical protein DSL72_002462 [Monilinia vaccinii-corymbosi]